MADSNIIVNSSTLPISLIIGTGIGMCGGMAVLFIITFGVFVKPITQDLGWSRSQVSLLVTMAFLGYAVGSPVLGSLFDLFGPRKVLTGGILLLAAGLATLGLLHLSPFAAAGVALLIGFVGATTAPTGYVLILATSTDKRLGLVLALSMLGYGLGVGLAPMAAQRLIATWGWRGGYLGLATAAVVLGSVPLLMGVGRSTGNGRTRRLVPAYVAPVGTGLALALADRRFWIIGVSALMLSVAGFGVTAHLAAILSDRGLDARIAARAVSMLGLGLFIGRVGAAAAMDRIFAPFIAVICSLLGGIGLCLLITLSGTNVIGLFFAAFLVGLLGGSEGDTMPFLTRRYFGTQAFGSIFGFIVALGGTGGILGPIAFGVSFDRAHSYSPMLMAAVALCMISAFLLVLLGPYRYPASGETGKQSSPQSDPAAA